MVTTYNIPNNSVLEYEFTQTRTSSKPWWKRTVAENRVVLSNARHQVWLILTCAKHCPDGGEEVSHIIDQVVECDVEDLAKEIELANSEMALMRQPVYSSDQIAESLMETDVSARESAGMFREDFDIRVVSSVVPLVRSTELVAYLRYVDERISEQASMESLGLTPDVLREWGRSRDANYEADNDVSIVELEEEERLYRERRATTYQLTTLPDGSMAIMNAPYTEPLPLLGRPGELEFLPSWTREEHSAKYADVSNRNVARRVIFATVVSALVQDARARWGLLVDTQANRLMVGHHMRKQCRNNDMRVSAVDVNVAFALNSFFVPQAHDVLARYQGESKAANERWRVYDTVGMSVFSGLWFRSRRASAPVV